MTQQSAASQITPHILRKYFFIAVACGGVSLALGSFIKWDRASEVETVAFYLLTLVGPVGVLAAYIYVGSSVHRENSHQFADSVYFLGFVFTLLALVMSMASLTDLQNDPDGLSEFLARFGVALLTTLIGLVARIALINFRESADDNLTKAQAALTRATNQFKIRLEAQSNSLLQTQQALTGFHETQLQRSAQTADDVAKYWLTSTEETAEHVNRMLEKTTADMTGVLADIGEQSKERLETAGTAMATVVEEAVTTMSATLPALVRSMDAASTEYVTTLERHAATIDAGLGTTATRLDESGDVLAASLVRQRTAVETTVKSLETIASGSTELAASLGQLKAQGVAASTAVQAVGQSMSQYGNVAQQLREIVDTLERLSKSCQEYEVAFQSQRDTLGTLVRHTAEDLKTVQAEKDKLRTAVQDAGETIAMMQTQFVEAAKYIRQELSR